MTFHDGKKAFGQAKTTLEYKYYTGPNEIIALEDLESEKTEETVVVGNTKQ